LPRSDAARPTLAEGLRERGAHVTDVVVYRTVTAGRDDRRGRAIAAMLAAGQVDALTFTSSSTVRGFATALGLSADGQPEFGVWPCVACIGPITAQTARKHGIPVHVVASTYTVAGLVDALIAYYGGNKQS